MSASRDRAARALLDMREKLQAAQLAADAAKRAYIEAEQRFLDECGAVGVPGAVAYPPNLLVDGMLIMPVDDWYDAEAGRLFRFDTVEVAE